MIITLYILFTILAFMFFAIAVFYNKSVANLFVWPVSVILFSTLFFASYNLTTTTTVVVEENVTIINENQSTSAYSYDQNEIRYEETAMSWMFLALAMLSVVLFMWDVFQQWKGAK